MLITMTIKSILNTFLLSFQSLIMTYEDSNYIIEVRSHWWNIWDEQFNISKISQIETAPCWTVLQLIYIIYTRLLVWVARHNNFYEGCLSRLWANGVINCKIRELRPTKNCPFKVTIGRSIRHLKRSKQCILELFIAGLSGYLLQISK